MTEGEPAFHPALSRLFSAWQQPTVPWALLRLPANPERPAGDIDLLVAPDAAARAFEIACALGFVEVPRRGPDTHLLSYHGGTGLWLWLHAVTELAFGPYRAVRLPVTGPLARRCAQGTVVRLAPGDEFWTTFLHAALDRGRFTDLDRERLAGTVMAAAADQEVSAAMRAVWGDRWTAVGVRSAVGAGSWEQLEHAAGTWRAGLRRLGRPRLADRIVGALAGRVGQLPSRFRSRGATVCLLGPDGAGKSTLADALVRDVPLPSRKIYMGLTGGWLRHADRIRVPGLVRLARLGIIWGRYARGVYHSMRGRLVVYDRYIYDAAVPTPHPLSLLRRLGRWVDGHSCPAPDVVLILDAPGSLMYRRKHAYTPEMLEDWRQQFRRLERRFPQAAVLDATQPAEIVHAEAMGRIWGCYAARWGACER